MMMVMMVTLMVMVGLGRRRDRHQHGDREKRRAEREPHLLHRCFSSNAIGSRRTVFLFTANPGGNAMKRITEGNVDFNLVV
jgi:hypothetical protein